MSFNVLVIPEDPTWNGYILKPLAKALLGAVGKPNAKVRLLENPRLRGYDQALGAIRGKLPGSYGFFDLWLFFPDADKAGQDAMQRLEGDLHGQGVSLFCCPAQPEVEIYACAAYRDGLPGGTWEQARTNPRMKEQVFEPLRRNLHGDSRRPGGGRDLMIEATLQNLPLLFQLCPETGRLRDRIAAHLQDD